MQIINEPLEENVIGTLMYKRDFSSTAFRVVITSDTDLKCWDSIHFGWIFFFYDAVLVEDSLVEGFVLKSYFRIEFDLFQSGTNILFKDTVELYSKEHLFSELPIQQRGRKVFRCCSGK